MYELTDQDFTIEGKHVSFTYKNGDLVDITIQEKGGEVLFTGNLTELETLAHIAGEVNLIHAEKI